MIARSFAVLAAVFLVGSVALAALLPLGTNLAQTLLDMSATSLDQFRAVTPVWIWEWLCLPLLVRPVWLLPACFGLVTAGVAASFNLGQASSSRRKRS